MNSSSPAYKGLKAGLITSLLLVLICLLVRCSEVHEERSNSLYSSEVAADWPVAKIHSRLENGLITFYPASDADWRQLIDMSIFEGFRPGMRFRDAQEKFGPPGLKGVGPLGPYWIYKRASGHVRISHEYMGSFFPFKWWILEAFPLPPHACALLHENVKKEIPARNSQLTIVIMNNLHHPGAFVKMKNGCVTSIQWANNPGSDSALLSRHSAGAPTSELGRIPGYSPGAVLICRPLSAARATSARKAERSRMGLVQC